MTKLISAIIPVYNTDEYLSECIDSLLCQNVNLEIIIINDGSTDNSYKVIDSYARKHKNIITYTQDNQGLSAARNKGLELAKGKYVIFIDSDDFIVPNALYELYRIAEENNADIVMGDMYRMGANLFRYTPEEIKEKIFSGPECFTELMKAGIYYPSACSFMYWSSWIKEHNLKFDRGILFEDELWTPIAFSVASKVFISNVPFYCYRVREGSIMTTLKNTKRIESLFYIVNRLTDYIRNNKFGNTEFENWFYANIFRLYALFIKTLATIRNTTYTPPRYDVNFIDILYAKLDQQTQEKYKKLYADTKDRFSHYQNWQTSIWKDNIKKLTQDTKLTLLYNSPPWYDLSVLLKDRLPSNYVITTDQKHLQSAHCVVFHLPELTHELESDLEKPDNQIWVSWNLECEKRFVWASRPETVELFDYRISYRQNADIIHPYYSYEFPEQYKQLQIQTTHKKNICMLISSKINRSKRQEYLTELCDYIEIDSYGSFLNNKILTNDQGLETRYKLYEQYKFIIAFENSISTDYVTEKFFDPLLKGAVPIYLGAPNIDEFVPGDNCFVDVRNFKSPKELAEFLSYCCENDSMYLEFQKWRTQPLKQTFIQKANAVRKNPLTRLCEFLEENKIL